LTRETRGEGEVEEDEGQHDILVEAVQYHLNRRNTSVSDDDDDDDEEEEEVMVVVVVVVDEE